MKRRSKKKKATRRRNPSRVFKVGKRAQEDVYMKASAFAAAKRRSGFAVEVIPTGSIFSRRSYKVTWRKRNGGRLKNALVWDSTHKRVRIAAPKKAKTNHWYKTIRGVRIRVRRSKGRFIVDVKK